VESFETDNSYKIDALGFRLKKAGIDISKWGTGGYKTIDHLLAEIECQEAILATDANGELLRKVEVVGAAIYHLTDDGNKYYLLEEKQIYIDGRERRRLAINNRSVFEKKKPNESPTEAMIRGVREELGLGGDIYLEETDTYHKIADSDSYPGLKAESTFYMFESILTQEQFNPDGYIERQPDKTTYFTWVKIE